MKVIATIILLILASLPFLVAPWIFLPILAGILVALPICVGTPNNEFFKKVVLWTKAILVGGAVVIAVWFIVLTPWIPAHTSVASRANISLSRLPGDSHRSDSPTLAAVEVDRLSLRAALQMERQRVTLISRALDLYQVARTEYQTQVNDGNPDEKLAIALKEFQSLFEKERADPSGSGKSIRLLAPEQLEIHLTHANQAIDKLEADGLANAVDSQALRRFKLGIPDALNSFQLDQPYLAVTTLQDRLKNSLKVQLSADSTYSAKYNRDDDSLISEQITRIRLSDNPASQIDLTGFFTSKDGHLSGGLNEEVSIQEDSYTEQVVPPKEPLYSLRSSTNQIVISKRIIRNNASEQISTGSLPLQFVQVRVDWPLPRSHTLTLALQERGNSNSTWPYVLSIENKDDASLSRILVPQYALYFVDPAIEMSTTASNDELTPNPVVGSLRALVPGSSQVIRIELLPSYLSNSSGQKFKEYLAIENISAALILWLITVVGIRALKPSNGTG